jgi:hypothetical protein
MLKNVTMILGVVAVSAATLAAQTTPHTPTPAMPAAAEAKPEPAAPKAPPEPPPLPLNIRIEVSITDQSGTNPPAKKVVTMIASDRMSTNVRSSASVPVKQTVFSGAPNASTPQTSYSYRTVQINVDARPAIVQKDPNKISMNFGLEYLPTTRLSAQEEGEPGLTSWNERLSVILESGKPMVVSQAADPTSDRKITVEVTATILK